MISIHHPPTGNLLRWVFFFQNKRVPTLCTKRSRLANNKHHFQCSLLWRMNVLCQDLAMNKNIAAIITALAIIFILTTVLLWLDLNFKTFNFIEGIYWLFLGIFTLTLSKIIPRKYKKLALFTSLILILFGITDFIEINTGAYWIPRWLLVWNMFCISGLILSLAWYIKLR